MDIIFNFEKAYFILDEFLMGGEVQETSKVAVAVAVEGADTLQEVLWVVCVHLNSELLKRVSLSLTTDDGGIHEQTSVLSWDEPRRVPIW